jgi:hypothetical protein
MLLQGVEEELGLVIVALGVGVLRVGQESLCLLFFGWGAGREERKE